MRINIIKQIFKKEVVDILRDKKTIFMMIILPIILYPILIVGISQFMLMSMNSTQQEDINIAFNKKPDEILINSINKSNDKRRKDNSELGSFKIKESKDYENDLTNGKIDAYIDITEKSGIKNFKVYTHSSKEASSMAKNEMIDVLDSYKEQLVENKISESGLDIKNTLEPISYETVDIAKNEEIAGHILGQILPFILIIGLLTGAIYPAIDVMAGEKERGTLETLFTLPITNLELVMGKYMAVSICAISSAILNVLSIFITLAYLLVSQGISSEMGIPNFNLSQMILPLITTLICICLFAMVVSAISMCICSLAKSFKDAQNYITPLMLIIMIPSYVSMVPNIALDSFTATIPVVNISLLIKSVLIFESDISLIALVLVSNLVFVIISVLLLSKMFNSEEILFGSGKNFYVLEKRSNIKKGTMPGVADGLTLYVLGVVLLIYVASLVQIKFGMIGLAITQVMIITLPLLFAFYIKADFKKTFNIKLPTFYQVLGGIILWIGTYIVVNIVASLLLYLFPQNIKIVESLNDVLKIDSSFILNLVIVALMPAICEEMFFRGFVFTSFSQNPNKKYKISAVIFTGILFGFMHIDFIRVIPISLLGIALSYAVYKSGSIIVPMLMHFINNSLAVFSLHYSNNELIIKASKVLSIDFSNLDIIKLIVLIIVSMILVLIGSKLLSKTN